jgi:hypothetical protein
MCTAVDAESPVPFFYFFNVDIDDESQNNDCVDPKFNVDSYEISYTANSGIESYDLKTLLETPFDPRCPLDF